MSQSPQDGMTVKQYAAHRGASLSFVYRLRRTARLVLTADGGVDAAASDARIATERYDLRGGDHGKMKAAPAAAPRVSPAGAPTLADAAREEKTERTRLLRMDIAERAGQLVRRDVVDSEVFRRGRQAQEALMALRDRLPPLLAIENDEHAIGILLDDEFRHVLALIAGATTPIAADLESGA